MALATRCPNCRAMFRVVADQLKLRGGLVRCGACRHVFDAIGSLSYVDDSGLPVTGAAPAAALPPAAAEPAPLTLRIEPAEPRDAGSQARHDDQGPVTLLAPGTGAAETAPRLPEQAPPEATAASEPLEAPAAADGQAAPAEPAFLRTGRRPGRKLSIVTGVGSLALVLLLLAQLAVVFRTEVLMWVPPARPFLVALCEVAGCSVGWPARADLLAVVGTELQAVPGTDILELTAVVRNRAPFTVAAPAIELTLTDPGSRIVARKVFAPVDYAGADGESAATRIDQGIGAGADHTIRISFEARGIGAAGFVVYPFYL